MGIHEQNYVRYEGELNLQQIPAFIAWNGFATYWSFLRTKLTLLLLSGSPLVALIAVVVEYSTMNTALGTMVAGGGGPSDVGIATFVGAQLSCLSLLLLASCCGVISDDLRYRTFQLYFSKPLGRLDYALGKFGGVMLLGSLVTLVPALVVGGLRLGVYAQTPYLGAILGKMAVGFGALVFGQVVLTLLLMGLSSLTSSTRYVVFAWLGVLIVPTLVGATVFIAAEAPAWGGLIGLLSCAGLMVEVVLDEEVAASLPVVAPYVVMAAWGALGAGLLARRVTTLDGVA